MTDRQAKEVIALLKEIRDLLMIPYGKSATR